MLSYLNVLTLFLTITDNLGTKMDTKVFKVLLCNSYVNIKPNVNNKYKYK